jgi:hypothetical protein
MTITQFIHIRLPLTTRELFTKVRETIVYIAEYLGGNRNRVSSWCHQHHELEEAALHYQMRGNKLGKGRILRLDQKQKIQDLMQCHFPNELDIYNVLWSPSAIFYQLNLAEYLNYDVN